MRLLLIAGPNGSGKSTSATLLVPAEATFINADDISREEGVSEIAAGRLFLQRLDSLAASGAEIVIETTLASRGLANRILGMKTAGYQFELVFMWLDSADIAVRRVAERVVSGGHSVPEETIRRRYESGLRNLFKVYLSLADSWRLYDNTRIGEPSLIANGRAGVEPIVYNESTWNRMLRGWRDD